MESQNEHQQVNQIPEVSTPSPVAQTPKSKLLLIPGGMFLLLLVIVGAYYLGTQKNNMTQKNLLSTPKKSTTTSTNALQNGYVYSYPGALLPFIAITKATKNCSAEYALYKDLRDYYDPVTGTNNQYYTGTSVSPDAWEKDAYEIAEVVGIDLTTNMLTGNVDIFASSCTPHYLFSATNFMIHGQGEDYIFVTPSPIVKLYSPNLAVNTEQFPLNDPLIKPGIAHLDTQPKFAMPEHCSCDGSGNPQTVTVSGQQFLADTISIQTNRSKKYDLMYQTLYTLHGKLVAKASYHSDGSLLSFIEL